MKVEHFLRLIRHKVPVLGLFVFIATIIGAIRAYEGGGFGDIKAEMDEWWSQCFIGGVVVEVLNSVLSCEYAWQRAVPANGSSKHPQATERSS